VEILGVELTAEEVPFTTGERLKNKIYNSERQENIRPFSVNRPKTVYVTYGTDGIK
jgi:hypothetical protein